MISCHFSLNNQSNSPPPHFPLSQPLEADLLALALRGQGPLYSQGTILVKLVMLQEVPHSVGDFLMVSKEHLQAK